MKPEMGSAWLAYTCHDRDVRMPLDKAEFILGRADDCDVVLETLNRNISRFHCKLKQSPEGWTVSDLNSRNGTHVNGHRISSDVRLTDGDTIRFHPGSSSELSIVFHDREDSDQTVFSEDEDAPPTVRASIRMQEFAGCGVGSPVSDAHAAPDVAATMSIGPVVEQTNLIELFNRMGQALLLSEGLDDMLEQVLDLAFDYLPAERGSICLYDELKDAITPKCSRRGPDKIPVEISRTVANVIIQRCEALLVSNPTDDTQFDMAASINRLDIHSIVCAPMYHEGKVLGFIYLDKLSGNDVPPFSRDHLDTLTAIAVFAAAGVRNAHLHDEFRQEQRRRALATNRIHVLLEVAKSLASELETGTLIKLINQRARDLLDAERCTLFRLNRDKGELISMVSDEEGGIRLPMDAGLAGHTAMTGELLNIHDAYQDPRFNQEIDRKTGFVTRNILSVPLRNKEGEIIGVTQILNKRTGDFNEEDEAVMEAFAAQSAIAIENAELFQKTVDLSNYLQSVLQSITNNVLTLDGDGHLATANCDVEPLLGLSEEFMRERHYTEWFAEHNAGLINDISRVYDEPRSVYVAEYELQLGDKVMSVNYNIVALMDFEQSQTGVVVVLEDISSQKRMMNTLGRYMSPKLAQKVLEEDEARLGGVRQSTAILFSDIRGYTSLTERMDATEIVDMLNNYFTLMVDAILEENGILDKYIGDALMAVFGVPFPAENDSERACRAALKMQCALQAFNQQRKSANLEPIRIGIGINTDVVVSGNIGSKKRAEYTCIGDGVNLASRLEGVTKTYGITTLLSEFTLQHIGNRFVTREVDSIRVIGKMQPVRAYELLGEADRELPEGMARTLSHFADGLQAYRHRDWDNAQRQFEAAVEIAEDPPARIFIERCRVYREDPPPDNWDGAWEMKSK